MNILVFSDSHGSPFAMLEAIRSSQPDMIIHLGDGGDDLDKIKSQFPQIPLKAVRGNCDYMPSLPKNELFTVNGIKIFLTHGHLHNVKMGLDVLLGAALEKDAGIVMFGHTHTAYSGCWGSLRVMNPGSCGNFSPSSYIELIIGDAGEISSRIIIF